ncbi:MAG: VWA domain-containing protein [Ferruginibacter sp.]|nr:VWA domain-containing protein [Ferruginibacter sp.]
MDVSFQHPIVFILLAAIPFLLLLYFFLVQWKKKTIKKIGNPLLVKELIKNYSPQKFVLKFILMLIAFTAGVFALANLRSPKTVEKVNRNGIDVMIALDVSKSMLAQDIKPTRLDRAKQVISKLIDKLSNDRIGIVVFAGRAYLQMPLTNDHSAAKMYLSSATPDVVPTQGTVIADALRMCYSSFNPAEKKYKAVILISDGEDHDEGAISQAKQMGDDGIAINTVGIGSPQGATIFDELTNQPKTDREGNIVVTRLNEDELKKIAEKGNGIYSLYSNTDELVNQLETQLNSMEKHTITEDSLINYKYYFQWFLMLALALMIVELFISERKKKYLPKASTAAFTSLLLLGICLLPLTSSAQNDNSIIDKGNQAYEKKDYNNAINDYKKVTEKSPANATAQYNLGNALYKNKKPDEAIQAYDNAIAANITKAEKSKVFYNKAVVLQNNKKLPECIEAYKNALKLNPDDEDARQNLQKALQQQKQEQQKNNKDNKDQKKPKEDKKNKQQQKQNEEDKNNQPKPQPSKLSKQEAEEKLKALLQQEKNLQDRLRRVNTTTSAKPEKDW